MNKLLLTILLLLGIILKHSVYAQDEEINVAGLVFLDYKETLPETVRSGKTIVLFNRTKVFQNQPFHKIADPLISKAHAVFTKAGIDVVGYYNFKQVFAGKESLYGFSESWKKRDIKNIFILSRVAFPKRKKEVIRYVLLATKFNQKPSLFSNKQLGWKAQGKNFENVLNKLVIAANRYERKNLLINDSPEYFNDVKMVWGEHVENYLMDLQPGKLAVPMFETITIPTPKPPGIINHLIAKQVKQANILNTENNKTLKEKMSLYNYDYEIVNPKTSDFELDKKGFDYILLRLYSSGLDIKRLLNYEFHEEKKSYTTITYDNNGGLTTHKIPATTLVYKYYIKHLRTANIYLGEKWDADKIWSLALEHLLVNLNAEQK